MNIKKASPEAIDEAVYILKGGGVVVVPTDTNYNVITHLHSKAGVERIFNMKKRSSISPLTLFLGNAIEATEYAHTTPLIEHLIKKIWPGQISFITWSKSTVPLYVTCGFPTVAITLHKNRILVEVANGLNMPVAGTSANLSGTGNVPEVKKAIDQIGSDVDLIIDAGPSSANDANSIIDFTFYHPVVARHGAFPVEKLLSDIPNLDVSVDNYKELIAKRIENKWAL